MKILNLSNVNLSDTGVRKLTLPTRMFGRGPVGLQELSLSENAGISDKSLPSLSCYSLLNVVDLSNTGATHRGAHALAEKLCLHPSSAPYRSGVRDEGWAVPILSQWRQNLHQLTSEKKRKLESPNKTGLFSYRKKINLEQLSPSKPHGAGTRSLVLRRLSGSTTAGDLFHVQRKLL